MNGAAVAEIEGDGEHLVGEMVAPGACRGNDASPATGLPGFNGARYPDNAIKMVITCSPFERVTITHSVVLKIFTTVHNNYVI